MHSSLHNSESWSQHIAEWMCCNFFFFFLQSSICKTSKRANFCNLIFSLFALNFTNKAINIWVMFRCWCKPGFTGSLCEYSEDMRHCEEDYCLHKGIGHLKNVSGVIKCECLCEENYGGDRVSYALLFSIVVGPKFIYVFAYRGFDRYLDVLIPVLW